MEIEFIKENFGTTYLEWGVKIDGRLTSPQSMDDKRVTFENGDKISLEFFTPLQLQLIKREISKIVYLKLK